MRIKKFEDDRYYVNSNGSEYLVDLGDLEGNGFCGCHDFQFRRLPIIEKEIIETGELKNFCRCKHLEFAIKMKEKVNGA